jgi:hypothetical protein
VPFDAKYCQSPGTVGRRTWQTEADFDLQDQARMDLFFARRPGGCESITQLSMTPLDAMWFQVLNQYKNIGPVLIIFSLFAMILSVVTTNDSGLYIHTHTHIRACVRVTCVSQQLFEPPTPLPHTNTAGSIVLNHIGSNGSLHTCPVQKQLWSFVIGLISIVMLIAGKSKALVAMQTCIVALGLPNTCQTCVVCYAVKLALDMELHDDTDVSKSVKEGRYNLLTKRDNGMEFWGMSILRPFKFFDYLITISRKHPPPTQPPSVREASLLWPTMTLFPFYWLGVCSLMCELGVTDASQIKLLRLDSSNKALVRAQAYVASSFVFFALFIGLCVASAWVENSWVLGMASYTMFFSVIALIRADIMVAYNLSGDVGRNLVAAALFYPFCIGQMYGQLQRKRPKAQAFSASFSAQASFKLRTGS